jgi:Fur family peroxide stress response transcriptional regulator
MLDQTDQHDLLNRALLGAGLRATRQREQVFDILMKERNHPTAEDIYHKARANHQELSLATVYNCLDTLVSCGLVRQVNLDRDSTRYCPNLEPHAHFHNEETGEIVDINLPTDLIRKIQDVIPPEYKITSMELNFRGHTTPAS